MSSLSRFAGLAGLMLLIGAIVAVSTLSLPGQWARDGAASAAAVGAGLLASRLIVLAFSASTRRERSLSRAGFLGLVVVTVAVAMVAFQTT